MKQLLQNIHNGLTEVVEVPIPQVQSGMALVHTQASLVSAGTERMLVEFAGKSLVGKALSRPDLVHQLVDKARREGVLSTVEAAFNRLDQPMPLGYSSSGVIDAIGEGVQSFKVGDRVACAGGGYAVHAEYALVPNNLLSTLPNNVDFESAAFTTLGAISLHGFRLSQPQLGETVAIIGLGLLGLLTVGIARAAGCQAFGVDLEPNRVTLAQQLGARAVLRENAIDAALSFTHGKGFDHVLICADSPPPIQLNSQEKSPVIEGMWLPLELSDSPSHAGYTTKKSCHLSILAPMVQDVTTQPTKKLVKIIPLVTSAGLKDVICKLSCNF